MLKTTRYISLFLILISIMGMCATYPDNTFWFTIFSILLGFGLSVVPMRFIFRDVVEDIANNFKNIIAPYYAALFTSRDSANKKGFDIPWALGKCQSSLIVIGLTSTTLHTRYRNEIIDCVQRGIDIDLYILDPKSEVIKLREAEFKFLDNTPTSKNVNNSVESFQNICRIDSIKNTNATLRVYGYNAIPYFEALGIDILADNSNSQMLITHTLFVSHTDKSPSIYLDKSSLLYSIYFKSIKAFIARTDHALICSNK